MPISTTKMTLDFEFNEGEVVYKLKFHETEEYGPTLSLSDDGVNWASFPINMFSEVVDELRSRGLIEGGIAPKQAPVGISGGGLPVPKSQGTLSKAKSVFGKSQNKVPLVTNKKSQKVEPPEDIVVEGDPFQSFSPEETEEVDAAIEMQETHDKPTPQQEQNVAEDEIAKEWAQRKAEMQKKANTQKGKIRKLDSAEE